MSFNDAFNLHILNQTVTRWWFQQPTHIEDSNDLFTSPCGYFTEYENGYKLIVVGWSPEETAIQVAMILDPEGVPVAKDTQDLHSSSEY